MARFPRMVGWYDPPQLVSTGIDVAVSATFGTRADYRLVEALAAGKPRPFDYGAGTDGLWLDFVADLGDGWNSTHAVATLLARDALDLADPAGGRHRLPRGRLLVMGGDEVYPTPDRDAYERKTEAPYRSAFAGVAEPGDLFAIPGNHDWYDGLVAFTRVFCQGRSMGGLRTRQERSYFALRLPGRWWLLGVDVQLDSDLDLPQLEYFREIARGMTPDDRIVLVMPEPDWIYAQLGRPAAEHNVAFLEREIATASGGARVQVRLSGDLHRYTHHASDGPEPVHNVGSGGGGAFLHPTHLDRVGDYRERRPQALSYRLQGEYPSRAQSRRLGWLNLLFPLWNPMFGLATALVYLVLSWWMPHGFDDLPLAAGNLGALPGRALDDLARAPLATLMVLFVVAAFILFTDERRPWFRWVAGPVHAGAHLGAALIASWVADRAAIAAGLTLQTFPSLVATTAVVLALGYLLGPVVMGFYLFVSLALGMHANEAFSSLRIQDHKNFLRLHLAADGVLTIYPVAVDRVPRRWRHRTGAGPGPEWEPADRPLEARLIEPPIRIAPPAPRGPALAPDPLRADLAAP